MQRFAYLVLCIAISTPAYGSSGEFLQPWASDTLNSFPGSVKRPSFQAGQSAYLFWTEHYDADIWKVKYWPAVICAHNELIAEYGLNSNYAQGYLYGWLFHEHLHTCIPEADNGAQGADPNSCLHLAIDYAAHGEACGEAADIKGDDCDGSGDDDNGTPPSDSGGADDAASTDDAQTSQQDTPEPDDSEDCDTELKGLCDFMSEMEQKWTNQEASACISDSPLSEGAKECGLSYPPAPAPGADPNASAIPPCGCC